MLDEDINPDTGKKEYEIKDDRPKLLPIFKDLLKDKEQEKANIKDLKKACKDKISPTDLKNELKDLVDLGAITEDFNPETKEKEYKMNDLEDKSDEPKLLPIIKDLLDDKKQDKVTKDDIGKAF